MVLTNKYTKILVEKFPNFAISGSLKVAESMYAENGKLNAHAVLSGLTYYVEEELIRNNMKITDEELEIYKFVEEIRNKYSSFEKGTPEREMDSAVCTCFLENLLNRASANDIEYSRFIPYLREKSKEYCRVWDEFTGVKSPGLW